MLIGPGINTISPRVLKILLRDKATGKNIVWATDNYAQLGDEFAAPCEILPELITGTNAHIIQPRVRKGQAEQSSRTRKRGEVFTPLGVCQKMCDHFDTVWAKADWKRYVDVRCLEITCGEAPFLVSRYDAATGETVPLSGRIGLLDRKLRAVGENAENEAEWLRWAIRAVESTYGYEYQGDSLLIARLNVLATYGDYLRKRWKREPTAKEQAKVANIIAWNLWQMDGLKNTTPIGSLESRNYIQLTLFGDEDPDPGGPIARRCVARNWRAKRSQPIAQDHSEEVRPMKFDYVIGNPPYQDETLGENKGFAPPIYHLFLEEAYKISDRVELIHPARFLFNAGSTPKAWNQKMLSDPHFKVLYHEQDSSHLFPNTDIKGGVVITYHDNVRDFGAIVSYTMFEELNSILHKVINKKENSLMDIVYIQNRFNLEILLSEHPDFKQSIGSNGRDSRLEKNIFAKIPIFTSDNNSDSIKVVGVFENKRVFRYIERKYLDFVHENLKKYKVVLPVANGSGEFGQVLSSPFIEAPFEAYTRSFIGIGAFDTQDEADALLKYLKSKFCRSMLSVLKVTQMNNKDVWKYVPLQDFTPASDIDWSKSIPEIDQQLYAKYGLTQEEIDFIESHVKEMT